MRESIRDAAAGQWLRLAGVKRFFRYPEEHPDFAIPTEYLRKAITDANQIPNTGPPTPDEIVKGQLVSALPTTQIASTESSTTDIEGDIIVVTWYSDGDSENPHNWSFTKKICIALLIMLYTMSVYIGSSLYTASIADVTSIFDVSETAAILGLSLYVLGYGIGPLLFAPLSEIPVIGRNPPYVYTYIIFLALAVATALVESFEGLLVLRILLGFFGSPALANAGASYGDFFGPREMPYVICLWGGGATLSPALGPLVAGFAVQAKDWRWSSWELVGFAGPVLLLVLISLPETSADNILLRRAERLRRLTGRSDLKSESEIKQA